MKTLLAILLPVHLFAQQFTVADAQTKEPIPFATITYGVTKGMYANASGEVLLPKNYKKADSIHISSLGYTAITLTFNKLKDTLFLTPETVTLNEVSVTSQKPTNSTVNYFANDPLNYPSFLLQSKKSTLVAVLQPLKTFSNNTYIHSVTVYFEKIIEYRKYKKELKTVKTLLRVNLYTVTDSLPSKQLYQSTPFYLDSFKADKIELDITEAHLKLPAEGFTIELELLGNYDTNLNTFVVTDDNNNIIKPLLRPKLSDVSKQNAYFKSTTYHKYAKDGQYIYQSLNDILNSHSRLLDDEKIFNKSLSCSIDLVSF